MAILRFDVTRRNRKSEVPEIVALGGVTRRPWQTAAMRGRVGTEPIRRERIGEVGDSLEDSPQRSARSRDRGGTGEY